MEINLKRNYGFELIFEADNIKVVEDIEEREYPKGEDGKFDFSKPPKRDIQTAAIEQFVSILADMIYYRNADFDSSDLVEGLFTKMPSEKREILLKEMCNYYNVEL